MFTWINSLKYYAVYKSYIRICKNQLLIKWNEWGWQNNVGVVHKDNTKRNIWKSNVFILGSNYLKKKEIILHAEGVT